MAHSTPSLPEQYRPILSVDLQKNKKLALGVNLAAAVIAVIMCVIMHKFVPIGTFFGFFSIAAVDLSVLLRLILRLIVTLLGTVAYIILHELVHGVTMKTFGCKKVKYGFTGLYAFAGSDAYFRKTAYLVISLAPVVLWGVALAVIQCFVPQEWVWPVYFIQVSNISGAAGDLYVTLRFARLPKDILVQDTGVSMTVYSAQ